jgi:hypothetical protein
MSGFCLDSFGDLVLRRFYIHIYIYIYSSSIIYTYLLLYIIYILLLYMYVYPYPFWLKEFIAGLHAIMELSLVGAFAVVVLCNPFLLLRTYDF